MCGIAAILSTKKKELIPEIITSLVNLEYRGYDSAGIAFLQEGTIKTHKCLGAPSQHLKKEDVYGSEQKPLYISLAIGHNRWSTHGEPSLANAHPHIDCSGDIALVHNGTILNYAVLKAQLVKQGHVFSSETDTEIIAHHIEEELKTTESFDDAVLATLAKLEGSFGLVVMHKDHPHKLFCAKNGSPLNIGITNDSFIVASSVNAILPYTDKFITLADGEFATLDTEQKKPTYIIWNFLDNIKTAIEKEEQTIAGISTEDLSKGDHDSFMHKEVHEQPAATRATIQGRYDKKEGTAVLGGLIDYKKHMSNITHIYTVACGTAHNAGRLGGEVIEALTNISVRNEIASEFKHKKKNFPPQKTAVITISQSGETADTIQAIKEARGKDYKVFGVVNVVGSTIAELTNAGVYTRAGAEIGVASTKAFTSQLAIFYLFALYLARERTMKKDEGKRFIKHLEEIPEKMKRVLKDENTIKRIVKKYKHIKNINFLGRGIHIPIAHEAALKFKELTYLEAGSYPLGELKHGPIAIVDKNCLSVIIMPRDELFDLSKNSIEQIKSKGGRVLIITDRSAQGDPILAKADDVIFLPTIEDPLFYPFLEIIPLQLFAYYFALALGNNVDKPRNLAKSVTVE